MTETPGLVSIVIPVYNGSATIAELAERLLAVFRSMNRACEILLVNDGSPDNSWEVIRALADAHPQVRGARGGAEAAGRRGRGTRRGVRRAGRGAARDVP
jgi:glycosyltransferase involved in cell wall biosynthesis